MLTASRWIAVSLVALLGAGCNEQQTAKPITTEDALIPAFANAAAPKCALRPVRYSHGRLKDKFLIGSGAGDPLKRGAVFAKRRIQINTDGAPNSYHADVINADQPKVGAINILCNAGPKLYPSGTWAYIKSFFVEPKSLKCYGKPWFTVDPKYANTYKSIKENNWEPAQGYRIAFKWNIFARAPSDTIWQSLFGPERPCVTDDGFFVSKTKLGNHEPKQACDQSAWLDANEVKAFVLPQHWFADWESPKAERWASFEPGDVVVAHRPADGDKPETWVYGIVGDAGPIYKYGEATLAFNWQLHGRTGNIRDEIRTYRSAIGLDTDMLDPVQTPVLVLEASAPALGGDYTPANIEVKAREAFAKWGGEARFKACLEVLN